MSGVQPKLPVHLEERDGRLELDLGGLSKTTTHILKLPSPPYEGLVENEWAGKTVKIGNTTLQITMPTPRCGMTVRPQGDIEYDKTILRTIVKEADQNLGVGAHCLEAGEIRVGDAVEVVD